MKTKLIDVLLSLSYPDRCPYCREFIPAGEYACSKCKKQFPDYSFKKIIPYENMVVSPVPYSDIFADGIKRLKFRKKRTHARQLSVVMTECVRENYPGISFDVITAVPLHKEDLDKRGFNQSELLAKSISRSLKIRYKSLLKKHKKNKPQHTLKANKRASNVRNVYSINKNADIKGKTVLLIDDVITTGYTLAECSLTLKKAGAKEVYSATFALSVSKTT